MKARIKRYIHNTNAFLERPIAVILIIALLFFYFAIGNIRFERENHKLIVSTNATTQNTNDIVHGQTDILNAIKKLANDTKLDSNEKTNIIICMLQVPIAERTADLQEKCRISVEHQLSNQTTSTNPGGAQSKSTAVPTTNTSSGQEGSQNTTSQDTTQQTLEPPKNQPVKILGINVCIPIVNICVNR